MDARRADLAKGACQEDITLPMDGVEPRSEADVALPLTEPNAAQSEDEHLLPSPVKPAADAAEEP